MEPAVNLNELEKYLYLLPDTFAQQMSGGRWHNYTYLQKISDIVFNAITEGNGRIILNVPPRHGKSEFISHWLPVFFIKNFPHQNIIQTTYEQDFSILWGRRVRNTIKSNPQLEIHFQEDSKAAGRWNTAEGGGMTCAGIGGAITGRGGNLVIIDDPVKNWQDAKSETVQQRNIDWFNSTLYTRLEPNATIIVLMTRWVENDLAGYLISEHEDDWIHIRFPAMAEPGDPLGRGEGEALCPERYDKEALLTIKKAVGSKVWAGLYQQRPAPEEGNVFKNEWWKYYRRLPELSFKLQSWDTAFKKGDENAYSVCQTWGQGETGYYLADQLREKLEYPELKRAIVNQYDKHRPDVVLVEDKASGQSVVQDLKRETSLPLIAVKAEPGNGKEIRADMVSPLIESGRVFLPNRATWLNDFLYETMHFPNSTFKDQVDAMSQGLQYFKEKKGRVISGVRVIRG